MATTLQTPLTHIRQAVTRWPSAPAFKIPIFGEGSGFGGYQVVTYTDFDADVLRYAKYWSTKLSHVAPGQVVSICLEGYKYIDVLHIFGLLRAGFVVHCFGSFPGSVDVLASLLHQVHSKAFIFEENWFDPTPLQAKESLGYLTFHASLEVREPIGLHEDGTYGYEEYEIAPIPNNVEPEQTVIIYHTSGSTSGTPKVIPYNYRQFDALILKVKFFVVPPDGNCQETWSWLGRTCYIAQFSRIINCMHFGCSMIQCIPNSATELRTMIEHGSLDRALMFPALLTRFLRQSREDPDLLALLTGLKCIHFSGGAVPYHELQYAKRSGINIKICFASNECSMALVSKEFQSPDVTAGDDPSYLYPITTVIGDEGSRLFAHRFVPYEGALKELVVLPTSADCPHKSFCNSEDGWSHHTGDLFEEVGEGRYLSRGRKDNWIKMEKAAKCDAGAIEDDVRETCDDLVFECVVVGTHRPSPALIVEPNTRNSMNMEEEARLKQEIFRRIVNLDSHSKRFVHEKIGSPERIIVAPVGTLIRTATKGNVCRQKTEEAFENELDRIYDSTVPV